MMQQPIQYCKEYIEASELYFFLQCHPLLTIELHPHIIHQMKVLLILTAILYLVSAFELHERLPAPVETQVRGPIPIEKTEQVVKEKEVQKEEEKFEPSHRQVVEEPTIHDDVPVMAEEVVVVPDEKKAEVEAVIEKEENNHPVEEHEHSGRRPGEREYNQMEEHKHYGPPPGYPRHDKHGQPENPEHPRPRHSERPDHAHKDKRHERPEQPEHRKHPEKPHNRNLPQPPSPPVTQLQNPTKPTFLGDAPPTIYETSTQTQDGFTNQINEDVFNMQIDFDGEFAFAILPFLLFGIVFSLLIKRCIRIKRRQVIMRQAALAAAAHHQQQQQPAYVHYMPQYPAYPAAYQMVPKEQSFQQYQYPQQQPQQQYRPHPQPVIYV